ncbi:hypothetical protein ABIE65_005469 [Constrictibacter sp. MBR-5]|jgi:hypothetical protein|uniref:hypothetical protein n=1 Tax=Constrictibacter sp. MBR-5 TaxID=3156467 RepID=UPI003397BFC9
MSAAALRRRWVPAAVVATAAAALIAMAVPRLVAGILLIPGDPILRRVLERVSVSAAELERLAESRRAALNWHARGRTGTDLGLALLLRAERMRIVVAERDLAPARAAIISALAQAPASPHGWLRLAILEQMATRDAGAVARLVEMSMLTGPAEREILFPRLELALAVWGHGTGPFRDLVRPQLDWAWRADRTATARIARRTGALDVLRTRLATNRPDELPALERVLARLSHEA